jgi:hypothetical protein
MTGNKHNPEGNSSDSGEPDPDLIGEGCIVIGDSG